MTASISKNFPNQVLGTISIGSPDYLHIEFGLLMPGSITTYWTEPIDHSFSKTSIQMALEPIETDNNITPLVFMLEAGYELFKSKHKM